jgi:hypothetical protein
MEQVREDKGKELAGVWAGAEAKAEKWAQAREAALVAEAVSRQAPEGTACVRNAEKRPFIRQERPALIRCVPSAAQP